MIVQELFDHSFTAKPTKMVARKRSLCQDRSPIAICLQGCPRIREAWQVPARILPIIESAKFSCQLHGSLDGLRSRYRGPQVQIDTIVQLGKLRTAQKILKFHIRRGDVRRLCQDARPSAIFAKSVAILAEEE
jgi:hypothetical protein